MRLGSNTRKKMNVLQIRINAGLTRKQAAELTKRSYWIVQQYEHGRIAKPDEYNAYRIALEKVAEEYYIPPIVKIPVRDYVAQNSRFCIFCTEKEDAMKVIRLLAKRKYRWDDGSALHCDNMHDVYNERTAYYINDRGNLEYCNIEYYKSQNFNIIMARDFLNIVF